MGRINKLKNQEFIISVVSRMNDPKPKVVLIGDEGDEKYIDKVKKLATKLNVNLDIRVNIPKEELIQEMKESKLFMYCPINEPFGIVIEEALASGLPIVAHRKGGGYSEILSERNGVLMNNINPTMWAIETDKLLKDKKWVRKIRVYNQSKTMLSLIDEKRMNKELMSIVASCLSK